METAPFEMEIVKSGEEEDVTLAQLSNSKSPRPKLKPSSSSSKVSLSIFGF